MLMLESFYDVASDIISDGPAHLKKTTTADGSYWTYPLSTLLCIESWDYGYTWR
jgi:hypothetical protein